MLVAPRAQSLLATLAHAGAGAVFAVITCGGIVEERLSCGSPAVALVANAFITLAAIFALGVVPPRDGSARVLVPQAVGAGLAIVAMHAALLAGLIDAAPWMSERPAQLVNDAVAVSCSLALVWAFARGMSVRLLAAALVVLTLYRATGRLWHLDVPPHAFAVPVQDFVVAQVVAAAIALLVLRGLVRREA